MPSVEVIPNSSTSSAAPGWTYVTDTGFDPSKAAIVPSGARKRARNSTFAGARANEPLSARQQASIAKHIADLDKENHRDVQIVVPDRPRDVGQRSISGKMTAGVKKILQSNKTWANYLADEEAAVALQQQQQLAKPSVVQQVEGMAHAPHRRGSTKQAKGATSKRGRPSISKQKVEFEPMDIDSPSTPQRPAEPTNANVIPTTTVNPCEDNDEDPFLRPRVPKMPTAAEIEALLSAPPLSYAAARAGPTTNTAPPRQFCEMCGYWGRARCMKCGARVCGLDCKTQHEETRCQKFYA